MTYYSANQAETKWQELNAKTLLGAKRECGRDYDAGSEILIAIRDNGQFTEITHRKPYENTWRPC